MAELLELPEERARALARHLGVWATDRGVTHLLAALAGFRDSIASAKDRKDARWLTQRLEEFEPFKTTRPPTPIDLALLADMLRKFVDVLECGAEELEKDPTFLLPPGRPQP